MVSGEQGVVGGVSKVASVGYVGCKLYKWHFVESFTIEICPVIAAISLYTISGTLLPGIPETCMI